MTGSVIGSLPRDVSLSVMCTSGSQVRVRCHVGVGGHIRVRGHVGVMVNMMTGSVSSDDFVLEKKKKRFEHFRQNQCR